MNNDEREATLLAAVAGVLKPHAGATQATSSRAWQLRAGDGSAAEVSASVQGYWLRLESGLVTRRGNALPSPRRAQSLLRGNPYLPVTMNYCVGARSRRACLIADVALDDDTVEEQIRCRVQTHLEEFLAALQRAPGRLAATPDRSLDGLFQPLSVDEPPGEAARALCGTTGWECHERGNGQLAITLEVPHQFCQAFAFSIGDGEFRLSTILDTPRTLSAVSRHAIATFLLTASHLVRSARAVAVPNGAECEYRWEVAWPQVPTAAQFHRGLSALSVACKLTRCELQALCDDAIARTYLMLRGRSLQ